MFHLFPVLLNNVDKRYSRFRRAEIMLLLVTLETTAGLALVLVVLRVNVSGTDIRFQIPAFT